LGWDTIELDERQEIPDLEPYDLMLVMGGPQDVWEEDQYPWMRTEKAAIRTFVMDMRRPYLGVCLGHQLLANAIGGKVGTAETPEIGVLTIPIRSNVFCASSGFESTRLPGPEK